MYLVQRLKINETNKLSEIEGFYGSGDGFTCGKYMGYAESEFGAASRSLWRIFDQIDQYEMVRVGKVRDTSKSLYLFCRKDNTPKILLEIKDKNNEMITKSGVNLWQHFEDVNNYLDRCSRVKTNCWHCIDLQYSAKMVEDGYNSNLGDWIVFIGNSKTKTRFLKVIDKMKPKFIKAWDGVSKEEKERALYRL